MVKLLAQGPEVLIDETVDQGCVTAGQQQGYKREQQGRSALEIRTLLEDDGHQDVVDQIDCVRPNSDFCDKPGIERTANEAIRELDCETDVSSLSSGVSH